MNECYVTILTCITCGVYAIKEYIKLQTVLIRFHCWYINELVVQQQQPMLSD